MNDLVVHAVGDVFVDRPQPAMAFSLVDGVLTSADVVFGNCEVPLSARPATSKDTSFVASAESAAGLAEAGFSVMSCANNHIMDAGPAVLRATVATLRANGVATAGAGADRTEAHRPALITTRGGTRMAVLAYATFFRVDDRAGDGRPGIAVVGGETILHTPQGICSPGVAPAATSITDPDDLAAMTSAIELAREQAELVFVSLHGGDATRPSVLTDHERRVAHAAIDAGADAVIGHHHHVLRGIELHHDKPIFYGLGNFVWDAPAGWAKDFSPATKERMDRLGKYAIRPRPGYPRLPFHPDSRMTAIARCRYESGQLRWCGFVPCRIRPDGLVEPLDGTSPEGRKVVDFVRAGCEDLLLPVTIEADPQEQVGGLTAVQVRAAG